MSTKNLTSQDVLEKNFRSGLRGYNAVEVDEFLDLVLQDYETYDKELAFLRAENARLVKRLSETEKQVSQTPTEDVQQKQTVQVGSVNYDVLKRLSNLEKHVFGSKLD